MDDEPVEVGIEAVDAEEAEVTDELIEGDDGDEETDEAPRRTALPRRVESWRTRTATGAVMSAMAMGLQQVFGKEIEKPAIVQEAPSDPYGEDAEVVVDYHADDAEGTTVLLRPWLRKTDDAAGE